MAKVEDLIKKKPQEDEKKKVSDLIVKKKSNQDGISTSSESPSQDGGLPSQTTDVSKYNYVWGESSPVIQASPKLTQTPTEQYQSTKEDEVKEEVVEPTPQGALYTIDGEEVDRQTFKNSMFDRDFVSKLQSGESTASVDNDNQMQSLAARQIQSGSELGDKWEYLKAGGYNLLSGVTGFNNYIANVLEEVTGLPTSQNISALTSKVASEELQKKVEEEIQKTRQYEENFVGSIGEENYLDAVNIGFNSLLESAPITVAAAASGGVAPAAISISSILVPAEYAKSNVSENDNIKNLSNAEKLVRSTAFGVAEGLGEAVTGGIASKNFSLLKDGMRNLVIKAAETGGVDAAQKTAQGLASKTATEILKAYGIDIAKEGGSEMFTQVSQDLTDDLMGVQDLTLENYLDNAVEAGALGSFMGGVMGGGGLTANTISAIRNSNNLEGNLKQKVADGELSDEEFIDSQNTIVAVSKVDPDLSEKKQAEAATLIKERDALQQEVDGLEVVSPAKQKRLDELNNQIAEIGQVKEESVDSEAKQTERQERLRELGEDLVNEPQEGFVLAEIPISEIEHGESAMGGRLTWPTSGELINDYANRDTDIPPIEVFKNEDDSYTISDGSHRLEAAKKRGQKTIMAYIPKEESVGLKVINQKPQEDAVQQIQRETEEGVLRDQRMEETSKETKEIPKEEVDKTDVFIDKGGFKNSLDKFRRRFFSAKRFLPKSVFLSKEQKEADIAVEMNRMQNNITDFNRIFNKYKGDKADLSNKFDRFIRGEEVELPDNLIPIGNSMRNQIDNLSLDLINGGYVNEYQSEKIKENIGEYLTRSYKVYDRKNWKNEVEDEVKQKAINFLKGQLSPIAEQVYERGESKKTKDEILDILVDQRIEDLLTKDGANNFISGGRLGSKDLSVLKQRKDIPFEIRALMGEYSDPIQNYARTINKMATLVANAKFLSEIKQQGMGKFFFEKNDINRPKEFNTQIAPEGSAAMNPLNGLYTTKEIADEFNNPDADTINPQGILGDIYRTYMAVISSVKWAKTIGSYATHMKNIFGNLGFMAVNGHYRLKPLSKSFQTIKSDITTSSNQELRDRMNDYIRLGIVKQSAGIGEIRDMFKDANLDDALTERLTNRKLNKFEKAKSLMLRGKKFAEDLYQSEDDFFKIIAYENESSRYSQALFGKDKSQLTEQERTELDNYVKEIVKNTYPTYSRVPEAIQLIRKFPFVGNFVSFQAEAWRTIWNTIKLGLDEVKSDNPKIRRIGAERMAGAIAYESAKDAMTGMFGMTAGTGLSGVWGALFNSDDEDERDSDVRKFVAPWSETSDLLVLNASNGKLEYIDFSASDPHGGIRKVFNAFLEGDGTIDAFAKGLYETAAPFIGEEIATNAILNIRNNDNGYGGTIYNEQDSEENKINDVLKYFYKTLELGSVKSLRRVYETDDKTQEFIASITGLRRYEVDIPTQFGYKARDLRKDIRDASRIYNSAYFKGDENIDDAYNRSNEAVKNIYKDVIELYNSAQRLGSSTTELDRILKESGYSAQKIYEIKSGKINDLMKRM